MAGVVSGIVDQLSAGSGLAAGPPEGAAPAAPPLTSVSMASSVTRHDQMTTSPPTVQFLACGVDTLDLGVYVNWKEVWDELFGKLEVQKQLAQSKNCVLWQETVLGPCLMHANGKAPMYRYHLELPQFHLWLQAQSEPKTSPNVYASPRAQTLWCNGVEQSVEQLVQLLGELGGQVINVQPSRMDLAADFLILGGLQLNFLLKSRVCRTRTTSHNLNDDQLETFYVGKKSGVVQARIYDKSREILAKKDKYWFLDIWKISRLLDVWRVEFQLRRTVLKEYGIESVANLKEKIGAIWRYLTAEWLSFRFADNEHTTRRTVHPWWQMVQACDGKFGPKSDAEREIIAPGVMPADWYVGHIAGCLVSYAARRDKPNLIAALVAIEDEVLAHWSSRNWEEEFAKKCIRLGRVPDTGEACDVPF